ncbi:hypothetical protein GUJ93_ZPchr0007g4172 [Zizania palustris]|uniref:Uncharacterized protein n=1 Tax=Zizania palustris TaxID=103762 RepID=A0A8J5SQ34_ZIZPA|nr:hypothetical protein GUJ93_ZPchr0007g4172 [Zizania palustris]
MHGLGPGQSLEVEKKARPWTAVAPGRRQAVDSAHCLDKIPGSGSGRCASNEMRAGSLGSAHHLMMADGDACKYATGWRHVAERSTQHDAAGRQQLAS